MTSTVILNLDNIPLDALSLIYRRLNPKDVFRLCQVSHRFADYSKRPELWIMLMREHYPTYQLTKTPRQQYKALANDHLTIYYVEGAEDPFDFMDFAYLKYPASADNYNTANPWLRQIEARGFPVENETDLWVVCAYSQVLSLTSSDHDLNYAAYNTHAEAVNEIVNNFYVDFLHLVESYLEESGAFASLTLDQAAADLDLPTPFSQKRLHEYLTKEGSMLSCRVGEIYLAVDLRLVTFMEMGQ